MRKPINVTPDGLAYALKASYFKNASLTTLTGGGHHFPCTGVIECEDSWPLESNEPDGRQGDKCGRARPYGDGGDARLRFRDDDGL